MGKESPLGRPAIGRPWSWLQQVIFAPWAPREPSDGNEQVLALEFWGYREMWAAGFLKDVMQSKWERKGSDIKMKWFQFGGAIFACQSSDGVWLSNRWELPFCALWAEQVQRCMRASINFLLLKGLFVMQWYVWEACKSVWEARVVHVGFIVYLMHAKGGICSKKSVGLSGCEDASKWLACLAMKTSWEAMLDASWHAKLTIREHATVELSSFVEDRVSSWEALMDASRETEVMRDLHAGLTVYLMHASKIASKKASSISKSKDLDSFMALGDGLLTAAGRVSTELESPSSSSPVNDAQCFHDSNEVVMPTSPYGSTMRDAKRIARSMGGMQCKCSSKRLKAIQEYYEHNNASHASSRACVEEFQRDLQGPPCDLEDRDEDNDEEEDDDKEGHARPSRHPSPNDNDDDDQDQPGTGPSSRGADTEQPQPPGLHIKPSPAPKEIEPEHMGAIGTTGGSQLQLFEKIKVWWEKGDELWKEWKEVLSPTKQKKTVRELKEDLLHFRAGMRFWKRHMAVLVKHTNALLQLSIEASKIPEKEIENKSSNEDTYREIGHKILFEVGMKSNQPKPRGWLAPASHCHKLAKVKVSKGKKKLYNLATKIWYALTPYEQQMLVKEPEIMEQTAIYRIIKKQTTTIAMEATTSSKRPAQSHQQPPMNKPPNKGKRKQ
ncbi:hypothetical protein L7F22_051025 [Adiantum nelumboides]|nr:hypothetical protein [Adiantum nelumboides]